MALSCHVSMRMDLEYRPLSVDMMTALAAATAAPATASSITSLAGSGQPEHWSPSASSSAQPASGGGSANAVLMRHFCSGDSVLGKLMSKCTIRLPRLPGVLRARENQTGAQG